MEYKYLDYNYCKVTLAGKYEITNVQTKGTPGGNTCAHLESLDISSSKVGEGNLTDLASSGTITLIDYKDSVFNVLRGDLQNFIANKKEDVSLLPTVDIEIQCFTGFRKWHGQITKWSLSFAGTTPSLQLEWSSIVSNLGNESSKTPAEAKVKPQSEWKTPKDFIEGMRSDCGDNLAITDKTGADISGNLQFIGTYNYNNSAVSSSGNSSRLVNEYSNMLTKCTVNGKPVVGKLNDQVNPPRFEVEYADASSNTEQTEEGKICGGLIFVQNGSYPYYKQRKDGKTVIPITSFSYNTDMFNLTLQHRIFQNPNGTTMSDNVNREVQVISDAPVEQGTEGAANKSSTIGVSFDCYNVTAFSLNNIHEPVEYEIYNEFGEEHVLSGKGVVTDCKFTLSGGVIKASVTATEVFNDAVNSSSGDSSGPSCSADDGSTASSSSGESSSQSNETPYVQYLRQEDSINVPLSNDKTQSCLSSGKFIEHVDEFLDRFGKLEKTNRNLEYDYVKKLMKDGDFGLLTLLIAVANYGIVNYPSYWEEDPVNHDPEFKKATPFRASSKGKKPYDYKEGGLGIAHWDSSNYNDIYSEIGFDPSIDESVQDHFAKLLTGTPPEKKKEEFTGKISGWKQGSFKGHARLMPVFQGKCWMREFDKGLKSDSEWSKWANDIVYYNGDDGRVYQQRLFTLWLDKFWFKTVSALNGASASRRPILQDAVRISRAGNSGSSHIKNSAGKNVSGQYDEYNPGEERYDRQKVFCKRLCHILAWEYKNGTFGSFSSSDIVSSVSSISSSITSVSTSSETLATMSSGMNESTPDMEISSNQVTETNNSTSASDFRSANLLDESSVSKAIDSNNKEKKDDNLRKFKMDWVGRLYSVFGLQCPTDHYFNDQLVQCIAAYQQSKGITADGIIGESTREKLEIDYPVLFDKMFGSHLSSRTIISAGTSSAARFNFYKDLIISQGGAWQDNKPNILGIRGVAKQSGSTGAVVQYDVNTSTRFNSGNDAVKENQPRYDDLIVVLVNNTAYEFKGSCDPGSPGEFSSKDPYGTGHLRDGQYEYKVGDHKGRKALIPCSTLEIIRTIKKNKSKNVSESDFKTSVRLIYQRHVSMISHGSRIDIHDAANGYTQSQGCQNIPQKLWDSFKQYWINVKGSIYYTLIDASKINKTI